MPNACVDAPHDPIPDAGSLDLGRRLSDLSAEEVRTWCRWLLRRAGGAEGEDVALRPEEMPGYASSGYASFSCSGALRGCMQLLPVDLCAQNILREPRCEATVQDLSDCAATMLNRCIRVGHGCAFLRAAPNCAQTVVQPGPSCATPLQ